MVRTRSPRTVQHRQPEFSVTMPSSSDFSTSRWSSPISPNSLMITAVSASSGRRSSLFSSVVLPLPKKPVSTVTGMRCFGGGLRVAHDSSCFRVSGVSPPEALGLPELLPRPLELAAAAFVAGCRLLGEGLAAAGSTSSEGRAAVAMSASIVGRPPRDRSGRRARPAGAPSPRYRAFASGRRKGRPQEVRRIAQLLDGDAQPVQALAVERSRAGGRAARPCRGAARARRGRNRRAGRSVLAGDSAARRRRAGRRSASKRAPDRAVRARSRWVLASRAGDPLHHRRHVARPSRSGRHAGRAPARIRRPATWPRPPARAPAASSARRRRRGTGRRRRAAGAAPPGSGGCRSAGGLPARWRDTSAGRHGTPPRSAAAPHRAGCRGRAGVREPCRAKP